MDIAVTIADSVATLHLKGRFDFNARRAFKEALDPLLNQTRINRLELDFGEVEYIDSAALGMLLLARERAEPVGKHIILSRPNSTVANALNIINFRKLFTVR